MYIYTLGFYIFYVCLGIVFHDQPFGLGKVGWDRSVHTAEEQSQLLRQVQASNSARDHCLTHFGMPCKPTTTLT